MEWMRAHEQILEGLALLSAITFLASLLILPLIIILMPSNYFVRPERVATKVSPWRFTLHILKNLLGAIIVILGILMLFLPGQGILGILVGCSLLDLPGKRHLQLRLLKNRKVQRSVAWIRRKANRVPIEIPDRLEV
jgi:archaellum biogenesis protein FlaJ (TadC family)